MQQDKESNWASKRNPEQAKQKDLDKFDPTQINTQELGQGFYSDGQRVLSPKGQIPGNLRDHKRSTSGLPGNSGVIGSQTGGPTSTRDNQQRGMNSNHGSSQNSLQAFDQGSKLLRKKNNSKNSAELKKVSSKQDVYIQPKEDSHEDVDALAGITKIIPPNNNNSRDHSVPNTGKDGSQGGGGRNTKPNSEDQLGGAFDQKQIQDEKVDDSSRLIQGQGNAAPANDFGKSFDKPLSLKEKSGAASHSKVLSPKSGMNESSSTNKRKSIFDDPEESDAGQEIDEFGNLKKKKKCQCSRKCLGKSVDNKYFVIWMTLLTIYALFFDDIRIIGFQNKDVDDGFFVMSSICLFFFVLEIVIASIGVEGYICGFFFWLDILATISIIPDIGWIWDPIIGEFTGANSAASVAKTSRASRAARVIRFVRLIRLIRLVKLYKQAKLAQQKLQERRDNKNKDKGLSQSLAQSKFVGVPAKESQFLRGTTLQIGARGGAINPVRRQSQQNKIRDSNQASGRISPQGVSQSQQRTPVNEINYEIGTGSPNHTNQQLQSRNQGNSINVNSPSYQTKSGQKLVNTNNNANAQEQIEIPTQSRISKKLSELTTKRVILLCMLLLFLLPLFNGDTFTQAVSSYNVGLQLLRSLNATPDYSQGLELFKSEHKDSKFKLLQLYVNGQLQYNNGQLSILRQSDFAEVQLQENPLYKVAYSTRYYNIRESIINIFRTIFVAAVLAIASIQFGRLAQNLVLSPIERMIEKVKVIAKNPLAAADDQAIEKAGLLTVALNQKKKKKNRNSCCKKSKAEEEEKEQYETVILEKTIIKIGHLLAVGFGQAGSQIIAENIAAGDLSLESSGQKMYAIFGFCDIRNFTDATEVLQTEVMMFVNQVAQVVHSVVDKFQGSANKNIGDAFLLVWKFDQSKNELRMEGNELVINRNNRSAQQRADLSILAFLKIIAKVAKLTQLVEYSRDPRILERMPGYSVKMGFGLHSGWAIEGAIGSEFKIDASYLSPNVNMASRLQAATKQYGVPLLISGALVQLCTAQMKNIVREIDTVTVKGSQNPMQLFTVDCDVSEFIQTKDRLADLPPKEKKARRMMEKRDLIKRLDKLQTIDLFKRDSEIVTLRKPFNFDFTPVFRQGYECYINGNWKLAKERFEEVLTVLKPNDGPSNTLLNVMQEHGFKSPENWRGFRELTDK